MRTPAIASTARKLGKPGSSVHATSPRSSSTRASTSTACIEPRRDHDLIGAAFDAARRREIARRRPAERQVAERGLITEERRPALRASAAQRGAAIALRETRRARVIRRETPAAAARFAACSRFGCFVPRRTPPRARAGRAHWAVVRGATLPARSGRGGAWPHRCRRRRAAREIHPPATGRTRRPRCCARRATRRRAAATMRRASPPASGRRRWRRGRFCRWIRARPDRASPYAPTTESTVPAIASPRSCLLAIYAAIARCELLIMAQYYMQKWPLS